MLTIGTCRLCGAGPLGLRRCGVCRRVVVLCDECDAAWPTADTGVRPTYSIEGDMPCPGCRASLVSDGSGWATRDEALEASWDIPMDGLREVPANDPAPPLRGN
ncbi:hypothetical protein Pla108_30460 [Botrimarina colliarenosi]|uniref:Uncharacterized protein n=1 Tax=Botrimarina colliarenosi TaxID=2528001 RepID=A0A5C6A9H6_9BACT|nr:hypothetical protein Pla108_30460 [Botrimarina colliarenosi]